MPRVSLLAAALILACATPSPVPTPAAPTPSVSPEERHLAELRQVTFGGENAEAYWSFDGKQLSFQARKSGEGCDRIFRMDLSADPPLPVQVSSGEGATTCAHFLPGDKDIVFASTHLGGVTCPPRPDHSQGYVWALYDGYDIFRAKADGTHLVQLTSTPGYDAEATVCPKDGSIVFTSTRDGDLELYRMDAGGKNVKRLTHSLGYDGGAFFNRDCTKLVWRASRPRPGKEADDYKRLLERGLVRPSKLELYVANADGSEPMQITYLNAASFAPFWHPSRDRIVFSTNHGDPKGREFEIWAIDADGTDLERVTYSPGFDGFPMFSPDGSRLAFSSNRATPEGKSDTNVFVARWVDSPPLREERDADRVAQDISWLAHPEREGRGIGTRGLEAAGAFLERRFAELGLEPAGDSGGFRQRFPVTTKVSVAAGTKLVLGGATVAADAYAVPGYSAQGEFSAPLVLAGYGVVDQKLGLDDYAKLDVKEKVVLVRRFVPETPKLSETQAQRRLGDIRQKAWLAKERGAKALLVVDWPEPPEPKKEGWKLPSEARLPALKPEGPSDAGIPVLVVKRSAVEKLLPRLEAGKKVAAEVSVRLAFELGDAFNLAGLMRAPASSGTLLIGAHYDHLGYGGPSSLSPDKREPHLGADDNASGVAALLEAARELSRRRAELKHDVLVLAFAGEEEGLLGSTHFTRQRGDGAIGGLTAMLNLDMVGRLRRNQLSVLGTDSADEWPNLLHVACERARVECATGGDGFGPSDHTPFYAAGAPVLHFFTGAHSDYHKPSDTPERINAAGTAQVARLVSSLAFELPAGRKLTYRKTSSPPPNGDARSFNASLGTIPDYAGPPAGVRGVLIADVRPGGAAALAGIRRGDLLLRLGTHDVGSVEDLMYVLNSSKPGETVTAVVMRDGAEVKLEATFQESKRR
ncbi:MAG: M20/M25/M40 family metallo-hydrolase [Myxococcales bacterium]|nr:M20/M25/M40 family metallo-hydrolase [Myxococcales bacterium]